MTRYGEIRRRKHAAKNSKGYKCDVRLCMATVSSISRKFSNFGVHATECNLPLASIHPSFLSGVSRDGIVGRPTSMK